MKGKFLTDQGRVRNRNEDSGGIFYNTAKQLLTVVADGVGGHQAGDVASQMAIELIQEKWALTEDMNTPETVEKWLEVTLEEINQKIWQKSTEKQEYEGMGTTIVSAVCTNEFITIAHIGDSRGYLLNNHGYKQLTEDHSLVNELVRTGQITEDDAENHPIKNVVVKVLGTEKEVSSDITTLEWENQNKLLLCSDGLTDKVTDEELHHHLEEEKDLQEIGYELISLANTRGGEDNISLAIVSHESSVKVGEDSC